MKTELLFGSDGLPLGFLSAKTLFQNPLFWLSPNFWFGQSGLRGRKKAKLVLVLFVCAIIALFAGPASALLLLPQAFTDWPAGGATFSLNGSDASLWPDNLTQPVSLCNISVPAFGLQSLGSRGCLPTSSLSMSQVLRGWRFGDSEITAIDVDDGLIHRQVHIWRPLADTWAITPHLAPCLFSEQISRVWQKEAILNADSTKQNGLRQNYVFRVANGTSVTMQSQIPLVRVNCFLNNTMKSFSDIVVPGVVSDFCTATRNLPSDRVSS